MYQHLNLMVAQSAARERERDLQLSLRQRASEAQRPPTAAQPEPPVETPVVHKHPRLDHMLVRLHLAHA